MVPFHFLMSMMLIISTLMVMSSCSWVSMWVAFEVNTLSFMPLMKSKGAAKYFLAQSLGSAMILCGAAFNQEVFVISGAMVKAGVAPFHVWFPQVMEHLSWSLCIVISTWQKISPMIIVFSCFGVQYFYFFIISSLMLGAIGALKQSRLRSILAYSSITHMGWVLSGVTISVSVGLVYFLAYCVMSFFVMLKLSKVNSYSSVVKDLSFVMVLFSMSGLPPLLGFFPKMWVLLGASLFLCVPLVVSSVLMTYVYTSMMFSSLGQVKSKFTSSSVLMMFFLTCLFF